MHPFDNAITSTPMPDPPSSLSTRVSADWSINGLPNGGYQMALLANAMLQRSAKNSIAIMTATFIARCAPGDARIDLEQIAASNQFERLEARLYQPDPADAGREREKIRAIGTFVAPDMACAINRKEAGPPEIAPRDQCVPMPHMPKFTLFDQMDVLMDPAGIGWMSGQLSDRSEHKGWIKFKQERPYDAVALLLIADSFPPPAFASQGMAAWVPTIEMSVNIRTLPTTAWHKCIFRTRFITCGLLEEDGEIWDESGELVAISRQIAQFRI